MLPSRSLDAADPEGLFRLAAESLPTGMIMVDAGGMIVLVNRQFEQQFGYAREQLVGLAVKTVLPDIILAVAADGQWQTLTGRKDDRTEFPVELDIRRVVVQDGVFFVGTVLDAMGQRGAQAEQETAARQLEFERLISELSYKFINLPPDDVIAAIQEALAQIGSALRVDRCSFWRMQPDGVPVVPLTWRQQGVAPNPTLKEPKDQFPWAFETLEAGNLLCFSRLDEVPSAVDRESYAALGVRSAVTVPMIVAGRMVGAIGFNMLREERQWPPETVQRMRVIASVFCNVLTRCESDVAMRQAILEVERVRDQLQAENLYLRREVQQHVSGTIIGRSPGMLRALEQIRQVAATDSTVLLLGETGTGKELLATHLHELSARRNHVMVRVNCAAIPAALIESELFGREKGAFTGALSRQVGRFELADRSTIFLDEIGDLPAEVQVKLLRVLEERQIERLGSPKSINVDVRIVAATHRNLEQRIAEDLFREDLFYRINVFPIEVPPLRERREDIPLLVWHFVEQFSKAFGKRIDAISRENMSALQRYSWPGNIRELRNVVERAMIVAGAGRELKIQVGAASAPARRSAKLTDVEREHIQSVLESTNWRIRGTDGAADRLGLKPTTLETRMAKLGLVRPTAE